MEQKKKILKEGDKTVLGERKRNEQDGTEREKNVKDGTMNMRKKGIRRMEKTRKTLEGRQNGSEWKEGIHGTEEKRKANEGRQTKRIWKEKEYVGGKEKSEGRETKQIQAEKKDCVQWSRRENKT